MATRTRTRETAAAVGGDARIEEDLDRKGVAWRFTDVSPDRHCSTRFRSCWCATSGGTSALRTAVSVGDEAQGRPLGPDFSIVDGRYQTMTRSPIGIVVDVAPLQLQDLPGTSTSCSAPVMHGVHHNGTYGAQGVLQHPGIQTGVELWKQSHQVAAEWLLSYGDATRSAYAVDIRDLFVFAAALAIPPLALRRPHVDLWVAHLSDERGLAARTVARRISSASSFFAWCVDEAELLTRNPVARVRRPKVTSGPPAVELDLDEMRALLAAAEEHGPRAHALLSVLLLNGLRISELVQADIADLGVDRGHRVLRCRRKGGQVERVPLADATVAAIARYIGGRTCGPLILSRSGRRLDRVNAGRLFKAVARTALPADKAARMHCHVARHAAITAAFDLGATSREVQGFAGHASADTTRLYDDRRHSLASSPVYLLARHLVADNAPELNGVLRLG